jgi:hypothetical protein
LNALKATFRAFDMGESPHLDDAITTRYQLSWRVGAELCHAYLFPMYHPGDYGIKARGKGDWARGFVFQRDDWKRLGEWLRGGT